MANRCYLRCLPRTTDHELTAIYSLPEAWCDLFATSDLHTGNECPLPDACTPETSSYLLAEAPVALERFASRMRRAGVSLTGDGLTARVYLWMTTHFAQGWLFADTTELEWMDEKNFVASTRKALASAEKHKKRTEFSERSLTLDLGWGTGLSAKEVEKTIRDARAAPLDTAKLVGRPYRPAETYAVHDQIAHHVFGSGTVRVATESTVTIAFPIGLKTLAHRRG